MRSQFAGLSPCTGGLPMAAAIRRVRRNAVVVMVSLALVMLLCASSVRGKEIKVLGFYPPFQNYNPRGERVVNSFTLVGGTSVKQSFVRLTPDVKEHYGSLHSRLTGRFNQNEGPGDGEFSAVMTFRVSGSVEKAHGKYLAFFIGLRDTIQKTGDTYGIREDFVGVGIVISPRPPADLSEVTADPSRPASPRQFVSFIANNGTRSTKDVRLVANSCASTLRYYEGREDFNFLKSSRVRLGYYGGEVTLEVDSRNTGVWRKCLTTTLTDMPDGWLERVGVAVVAETGKDVQNHHDVMSLEVYTAKSDAFDVKKVDGTFEDEDPARDLEEYKKTRMWAMKAKLEHEFDSVERILKDSVEKLADINDGMERRLTKLEKDVSTEAFARLNKRVRDMEKRVTANTAPALESRLMGVEETWSGEVGDQLEQILTTSTGHRLPFIFVLSVVVLLFAASVKQYRKLMRSNLLGGMR